MTKRLFEKLELYPLPHELTKKFTKFKPLKNVNLIIEGSVDKETIQYIETILNNTSYKIVSHLTELNADCLNILLGIQDSKGLVSDYCQKQGLSLKEQGFDSYLLDINQQVITILGLDSDGVFTGISTLRQILSQLEEELPDLTIHDYADTKVRGFIEGYYGIPWSNENREDLMRFGGQFKMNAYIFAPKDDPYHRDEWDKLYPQEKLEEIRELATVGNQTKCRFVWTIAPLQKVAKLANEKQDVMSLLKENTEKMLAKFEQLYEVGVRQFGVLGDDVGTLPHDYVVKLMQKAHEWVAQKGDVYNLVYCPASYNSAWAWNSEELNAYEAGFPEDIQIFWTGSKTCGPIVQETIDTFKTKDNNGKVRRDPLFWLNWPVNDIDMTQVFLGKGEMLELGIKNLAGAVTNPMQEAQASKIALFVLADYTWNTRDFNADKNWQHAFKYVEPKAKEALALLASHMTNTGVDGILDLEESATMKEMIPIVLKMVKNGEVLGETYGMPMEDELVDIIESADFFLAEGENKALVKELEPFILALKELALTGHLLLQATEAKEKGQTQKQHEMYEKAQIVYEMSQKHQRPTLKDTIYAKPAQRHLRPFVKELMEILK